MKDLGRGYMECKMMAEWAKEQMKTHATIMVMNDTIQKQFNEVIARGNKSTHKNPITIDGTRYG
jgi:hypothetical protein